MSAFRVTSILKSPVTPALFLAAFITQEGAAEPVPNESVVSLQRDLIDAEFSQSRSQFVWADFNGNIWVGDVDPDTGLFEPANGKGELVDPEAMGTPDLGITFNGPEWVSTDEGDKIVYTKFKPVGVHTLRTARLALAQKGADGLWYYSYLGPDRPRIAPYASYDANDPTPRITYRNYWGSPLWRELYAASTEERIPLLPLSIKSVRFVDGRRAAIFSTPVDGISQVFLYDLDTKILEQLTFDAGDKDVQTVPWMWQAPEYGNAHVFMTVVDNEELRIYRSVDLGQGPQWVPIHTVGMPVGGKPASPEPFIHNGQSYVFMVMNFEPDNFPSSVWLANIDPSAPVFYQISDDSRLRARSDPEVFITTNGPYIYYNRYNPAIDPEHPFCGACSEGVFRAHTGLPPPQ